VPEPREGGAICIIFRRPLHLSRPRASSPPSPLAADAAAQSLDLAAATVGALKPSVRF
ncbi:unnamed protein product, partial [Musa acuminata subsp. burmannicoides]